MENSFFKKNLKVISPIVRAIMLLTVAIVLVCAFTSCGDKIDEIYVSNSHAPRLSYVQGQDLDLSGGVLTVVVKGEDTLVPLNSSEVSVTGYDKNQLGDQTLTVTYGEHSTTIKVNVIARATAEGYEKGYFVGDTFKKDKGKIRIAKDDATTFTVNMSDSKISVVSFDSATAGTKTVKVEYSDGTVTYPCEFNVEVYAGNDVTIRYPDKTSYYSHDTALDFSGGYLTVVAGENNSLSKHVDITTDMVSGFNPALATIANKDTPLTQKITISYLGKTFEYNVTIRYSSVSIIRDKLPTLKAIDFSKSDFDMTDAEITAAYEAITEYYTLSSKQKTLFNNDDTELIVRSASYAVLKKYVAELDEIKHGVALTSQLSVVLTAASKQDALDAIPALEDANSNLNKYSVILRDLKADFPDVIVLDEYKVSDFVFVIAKEEQDNVVIVLKHLVKVYEYLEDIPNDWTADDLVAHKDNIKAAVSEIERENYAGRSMSSIYTSLSKWRANDDVFEIIYSYYLYKEDNGSEYVKETMINYVPLPKALNTWLSAYSNILYIAQVLSQTGTQYALTDMSVMLYYYDVLTKETKSIKDSSDTLTKDIYNLLDGDMYLESARTSPYCYYYIVGVGYKSEAYYNLLEKYLVVYDLYAQNKLTSEDGTIVIPDEYYDEFDAVTAALGKVTPNDLFGFLSSINYYYGNLNDYSKVMALTLAQTENGNVGYLNAFSLLMNYYYKQVLPEDVYPMFNELLMAMERLSQNGKYANALTDFAKSVKVIEDWYQGASNTNKDIFDNHFRNTYAGYLGLYNEFNKQPATEISEKANAALNELAKTLDAISKIYDDIKNIDFTNADSVATMKEGTLIVLYALYEKAEFYYNYIITYGAGSEEPGNERAAEPEAILALYNKLYTINSKSTTLAAEFNVAGKIYWYYLTNLVLQYSLDDGSLRYIVAFDVYAGTKLYGYTGFLAYSADLIEKYYNNGNMADLNDENKLLIVSIEDTIKFFCMLESYDIGFLNAYGGYNLFVNAMEAYLGELLKDDANTLALANKLVAAIKAGYINTLGENSSGDEVEAFKAAMVEAIALQGNITDTTNYDLCVKDLYEHLLAVYNKLITPPTP